eukprot:Pompholyxophrys_sp_v1_NODE_11_length_5290_cov_18.520778.p2 type:complete len:299 gc:universal NODE_11_length_5290_cov_18.520778:1265-2161(+)
MTSQAKLTIAQLVLFNTSKSLPLQRHRLDREPPLPLYVALKVYSLFRSEKLIDFLFKLGLTVSYDRVLDTVDALAERFCRQIEEEKVVCPSNLLKNMFTVCGYDNVDHNPSSTTAKGSFHGTAITAMQNICHFTDMPMNEIRQAPPSLIFKKKHGLHWLPDDYVVVTEVLESKKMNPPQIEHTLIENVNPSFLSRQKKEEEDWYESIFHTLSLYLRDIGKREYSLTWAAFHSFSDKLNSHRPALIGMLPVFQEKAATISMVKHGMTVVRALTMFLKNDQIPVMAVDQPLFALAKSVQW